MLATTFGNHIGDAFSDAAASVSGLVGFSVGGDASAGTPETQGAGPPPATGMPSFLSKVMHAPTPGMFTGSAFQSALPAPSAPVNALAARFTTVQRGLALEAQAPKAMQALRALQVQAPPKKTTSSLLVEILGGVAAGAAIVWTVKKLRGKP